MATCRGQWAQPTGSTEEEEEGRCIQQSIQEAVLRDHRRKSLGTSFKLNGLIFSSKASRDFGSNNVGLKRRHAPLAAVGRSVRPGLSETQQEKLPPGQLLPREQEQVAYMGGRGAKEPCKLEEDHILSNTAWMVMFLTDANSNSQTAEEIKSG